MSDLDLEYARKLKALVAEMRRDDVDFTGEGTVYVGKYWVHLGYSSDDPVTIYANTGDRKAHWKDRWVEVE